MMAWETQRTSSSPLGDRLDQQEKNNKYLLKGKVSQMMMEY